MSAPLACICGVGASTPIGRTAWTTAAAARAGFCGFREHPYMIDTAGEPMRVARVPWIDIDVQGAQRLALLLIPAIDEALQNTSGLNRIALAVGLPPPRPGSQPDLAAALKQLLAERYADRITPMLTYELGHAAPFVALNAALDGLTAGSMQACIVAGVDSYLSAPTLEWLDDCEQLHGAGVLNNAWGFIPGESAAALLVLPPRPCTSALASIVSIGIGAETRLIKTDTVCLGEGLTQAFRAAFEGLQPEARIDNIYCDMNGEAYRADEYGFTALRTAERFRSATDFVTPADCWGDVGAAGGPLHVLLAIAACRKGYAKGPLSLVWGSSESGERAAAVIDSPVVARE